MSDSRRILLLFAFAVSRGLLSAGDAALALKQLRGSSAAALLSGAQLREETLGPWWAGLDPAVREALQRELAEIEHDAGRAEVLVITSPIPDVEKRAWWGEDASQVAQGDVVVDIDFAMSQTVHGPSFGRGAAPSLPRLAPDERYTVQREVARGGMGRILLAKDVTLGRNVAMKEILSGAEEGGAAPEDVERFLREARITGQLEHPNIVPVHELGQRADGRMYYTMKMVRGETMEKRLSSIQRDERLGDGGKLEKRLKLLDAFVDVCQAMAYAHARGVVNRDLKPSNIMLGDFGETVVLDWGLARVAGTEDRARKDVERVTLSIQPGGGPGSSKLTMDGAILGTPSYMSPEQARGELDLVDATSDVYSLGAILYEIVTGMTPFVGASAMDVVRAVAASEPPAVSAVEPLAPRELEALIQRAMAKDRSRRLASAKLLAEEVLAYRDGRALSTLTYTGFQQVARWVKRHKGATAGIAAAALALLGGTAASTYYARHASEQKRDAQLSEQRATAEAGKAAARAKDAEAAARRAEGLRLAAKARVQVAKNPGQALWLAIRGAEMEPSSETNSALLESLARIAERRRLFGCEAYLSVIAFSADGTRVAGGGEDMAVRIWDTRTGDAVMRLDGHTGHVTQVEYSPDGARLLSAAKDGTVRIWGVAEGRAIAALRGHGEQARGSWSADGRTVLTWGEGVEARAWSADGAGPVVLGAKGTAATWAAMSPDGRRAAVATAASVEIVDSANGARVASAATPAALRRIAWTPDGREIVGAGRDGRLRTWDSASGTGRLDAPIGDGKPLVDLEISPDGHFAATRLASELLIVRILDGQVEARYPYDHASITPVFSPDWKTFLRPEGSTDFSAVDVRTGAVVSTYAAHWYAVRQFAYSRDGRQIASASQDMTAALWDAQPGREIPWLPGAREGERLLDVDADRRLALVAPASGRGLRVMDLSTGSEIRTLGGEQPAPGGAIFLPDNAILSWDAEPPAIRVLDGRSGAELRAIKPAGSRCLELRRDGDFLVASFKSDGPDVYAVWTLEGHPRGSVAIEERVLQFAVSPDGKTLVTSHGGRGFAALTDVATGRRVHVLKGHSGSVIAARFLGDGTRCITAAADGSSRIWDTATGRSVTTLRWPRIEALRVAPSPDGRLAWVFGAAEARLFDTDSGRRLAQLDSRSFVLNAMWTKDASAAVFFGREGTLRLLPTDPLPAARRALPRELTPFEMAELEVGTPEERAAAGKAFSERHPRAMDRSGQGDARLGAGKPEEAVACYRSALEIYPRSVDALFGMAQAYSMLASKEPEGSDARKQHVDAGLEMVRKALECGFSPEDLEHPQAGIDALKADPRWREAAAVRPDR